MADVKFSFGELDEFFLFELGGYKYKMHYPNTEVIHQTEQLESRLKELQNKVGKLIKSGKTPTKTDKDSIKKLEKDLEDIVYNSVEKVDDTAPNLRDNIEKFSMRTQIAFYTALYKEFYSLIQDQEDSTEE